jgi:hypothetical protein
MTWIAAPDGTRLTIKPTGLLVGRCPHCDVVLTEPDAIRVQAIVFAGPAVTLRFHLSDLLRVEAVAAIEIDGVACEPGTVEILHPGAVIRCAGGQFEVVSANPLSLNATGSHPASLGDDPSEVHLEFLMRGGRLTVGCRGVERAVYLPGRRCDLVAALLKPPPPFAPGDFVPDEVILPRIWPGRSMSRVNLNVLIHRARHDLVRAAINGAALLDRAVGGSATRFRMASGAQVTVD